MYDNAIPVFEMKNKLSFYLHKAESSGPVFISNRGKTAFVLQTIEDYEQNIKKEKTPFEAVAEIRKKYGLTDSDFSEDLTDYFDNLKDHSYSGPSDSDHIFDGV